MQTLMNDTALFYVLLNDKSQFGQLLDEGRHSVGLNSDLNRGRFWPSTPIRHHATKRPQRGALIGYLRPTFLVLDFSPRKFG